MDVLVAELIRAHGLVAITTQEAGQLHNSDAEQLAYAVREEKTLVTHNRVDFEALARAYFTTNQFHYGIIFVVRRPPQEITRRLLRILNSVTAEEMRDQVRYI